MQVAQPFHQRIRVAVAESSVIGSQLLAETLARDQGIDIVGFGTDPYQVLRNAIAQPDILLISARLEEHPTRGLEVLRQLQADHNGFKAVVLLDSAKPDVVVESFRSGAAGVFCRSAPINTLHKCIGAVHDGQVWANSKELGFVLQAFTRSQPFSSADGNGMTLLSTREREVVQCIAEALTNQQIAEKLQLSQHTVKNYIFRIFEKLGVSNRVELIFYVLSHRAGNGEAVQRLGPRNSVLTAARVTQKSIG